MIKKRIKLAVIKPNSDGKFTEEGRTYFNKDDCEILLPIKYEETLSGEFNRIDFNFLSTTLKERIPAGTFVQFILDDTNDDTFEPQGKENHIYVVTNSQLKNTPLKDPLHGMKKVYQHSLAIAEPLFLWRSVRLENIAFTDMGRQRIFNPDGSASLVEDDKKPTIDFMIDRILKLTGDYPHGHSWYEDVEVQLTEDQLVRIKSIGPLSESFTDTTLHGAISLLASYFETTPLLTINMTKTGKPFTLTFLDTAVTSIASKTVIDWETLSKGHSGWHETEDEYQTGKGVLSDIRSLTLGKPQYYPNSEIGPEYTTVFKNNLIKLPSTVQKAERAVVKVCGYSIGNSLVLNITDSNMIIGEFEVPLISKEEYDTLSKVAKGGVGYYRRGSDEVFLTLGAIEAAFFKAARDVTGAKIELLKSEAGLTFTDDLKVVATLPIHDNNFNRNKIYIASTNCYRYYVSIEYYGIVDSRLRVTDNNSETTKLLEDALNQHSFNATLSTVYPLIQTHYNRKYKSDLVLHKVYVDYSDIAKVGTIVIKDGYTSIITTANIEIDKGKISVVYLLNRNGIKTSSLIPYDKSQKKVLPGTVDTVNRSLSIYEKVLVSLTDEKTPLVTNIVSSPVLLWPTEAEHCFLWKTVLSNPEKLDNSGVPVSEDPKASVYPFGGSFVFGVSAYSNLYFKEVTGKLSDLESTPKITNTMGRIATLHTEILFSEPAYYDEVFTPITENGFVLRNALLDKSDLWQVVFLNELSNSKTFEDYHGSFWNSDNAYHAIWLDYLSLSFPFRDHIVFKHQNGYLSTTYIPYNEKIFIKCDLPILKDTAEIPNVVIQIELVGSSHTKLFSRAFTTIHPFISPKKIYDLRAVFFDEICPIANDIVYEAGYTDATELIVFNASKTLIDQYSTRLTSEELIDNGGSSIRIIPENHSLVHGKRVMIFCKNPNQVEDNREWLVLMLADHPRHQQGESYKADSLYISLSSAKIQNY